MFKTQNLLKDNWNNVVEILNRYEAKETIIELKPRIDSFIMKVPLVGIFSAGKSTLINTLVDEKLLSVQINPETAIATELYYTNNDDYVVGYQANGESKSLSKELLCQQDLDEVIRTDASGNQGWVEAHLNSEVLAKFPHLSIVDLPGLDSNLVSHNQIIDKYIEQSLAYLIVVSIEDGDVRESTQQFLQELNINNMPLILVLTKSDVKHTDDIPLIRQMMEASITKLLGKSPLKTVVVNRKGDNFDQLITALQSIEEKAERQFNKVITSKVIGQLQFTEKNLDKLLSIDDITIETLNAEKETLQREISTFSNKIKRDGNHLQSQAGTVIRHIADTLESKLTEQLDYLAEQILDQRNISHLITNLARLTVSEGLQQELAPLLMNYVDNINSEMPDSIQIETPELDLSEIPESDLSLNEMAFTLAPILALLKFNPIIATISTVIIPSLAKLADIFISEAKHEAQQAAREESAKSTVIVNVIPKIRYDIEQSLKNLVADNIETALQNMQALVVSREQQVKTQVNQKEQDIKASEAERQQRHEVYVKDKGLLRDLREQLIEASV